ncbi:LysR substrate-binding domain-containing protein [Brochothrix campestris]|uniref:LysR substrate-binding domain-containing protein n=1 Tax=Brochothrix campestris TaxID=2757 RepID=UPI0038D0D493
MLDYHYETFLTVCKTLNYTRAAELMNMSQPAVSNHIAFLEQRMNTKLFIHKNKKVFLTDEGKLLYDKIQFMMNYSNKTLDELNSMNYTKINLGCTLAVSDYIIPSFFVEMFKEQNEFKLNVLVENTKTLLSYLAQGKIDAAFIEGDFNKKVFSSIPFSKATIIGVCSPEFELADHVLSFEDLFDYELIVRELGSGTRKSLESHLSEEQIDLASFKHQTTLGSIDLIKRVVEQNIGITFMFDVCVQDELARGTLKKLNLSREFKPKQMNFVYLSDNPTTDFILKMREQFTD